MLSWLVSLVAAGEFTEIDVAALNTKREAGEVPVLLDVRSDREVAEIRVPGVVHIPLDQLPERLDELDKEKPVHVICHSGGRSARASSLLADQGYTAINVAGGTSAWAKAGYPTEAGPLDAPAAPAE